MKKDMSIQEIAAYAAGIIDGEGCIGLYRTKHNNIDNWNYSITVKVCMTHLQTIEWLYKQFGGSLDIQRQKKTGWKPLYEWRVTKLELVETVIRTVLPYLITKLDRAHVALTFIYSRFDGEQCIDNAEALFLQMKELNKRGIEEVQGENNA